MHLLKSPAMPLDWPPQETYLLAFRSLVGMTVRDWQDRRLWVRAQAGNASTMNAQCTTVLFSRHADTVGRTWWWMGTARLPTVMILLSSWAGGFAESPPDISTDGIGTRTVKLAARYFVDRGSHADINDALAALTSQSSGSAVLPFDGGHNPYPVWVYLPIYSAHPETASDWVLCLDNTMVDTVDLYRRDPDGWRLCAHYDRFSPTRQPVFSSIYPSFRLVASQQSRQEYLMRVKCTDVCAISLTISAVPTFTSFLNSASVLFGSYMGAGASIRVRDSGPGFGATTGSTGLRMGIDNVKERLALAFGAGCSIRFHDDRGAIVDIEVTAA
jgi:hypothetical protein